MIGLFVIALGCGGGTKSSTEDELSTAGGTVSLGDVTIHVPPGALSEPATVTITRASDDNPPPAGLEAADSVGEAFAFDLGGQPLAKAVTLEIPYDADDLPEGTSEETVFLAYFDEESGAWIPVSGEVDTERGIIAVQTDHLSWWNPWTWNWGAWIAVLNNVLTLNLTDLFDAVTLLVEECSQGGNTVTVDTSDANNVIQGCVEGDGGSNPQLRVVNPKSFFYEVRSTSHEGNMFPQRILGPGDSARFEAPLSSTPPLVYTAEINQRSGLYLIAHLIIQMLPGLNQVGIQGAQIACITERLADVAPLAAAVESLLVQHDGAAAAEDIANFMLDEGAVLRFITASDECFYGAAATWSPEGIRQIGAATATIMSATDFVANYFLNYHSEVAFSWTPPTPTPAPTPTPKLPPSSGELAGALITLQDLPVGWTIATVEDNDSDSDTDPCGLGSIGAEPAASVEASYQRSGYGPLLIHTVEAYPPGTAAGVMEAVRQISSCVFQEGFYEITVTISPISFPLLGDETVAVRMHFENQYFSLGDADVVAIRRGDLISSIVLLSDPIDSTQTVSFARLADSKLDELLQ